MLWHVSCGISSWQNMSTAMLYQFTFREDNTRRNTHVRNNFDCRRDLDAVRRTTNVATQPSVGLLSEWWSWFDLSYSDHPVADWQALIRFCNQDVGNLRGFKSLGGLKRITLALPPGILRTLVATYLADKT